MGALHAAVQVRSRTGLILPLLLALFRQQHCRPPRQSHYRCRPGVALANCLGKPRRYALLLRTRPPTRPHRCGEPYVRELSTPSRQGCCQKTCAVAHRPFARHTQYPDQTGVRAVPLLDSVIESQLKASYCLGPRVRDGTPSKPRCPARRGFAKLVTRRVVNPRLRARL
jgi:hypothetical protein